MAKDKDSSKLWTVFSLAAALGAAALAKKALDKSWTVATGKEPPENPASSAPVSPASAPHSV